MEQDFEATERKQVFAFSSSRDIVSQALKNTINHTNTPPANAVPTGFYKLDQKISGFKKAELTTIAVRPGMGKTSFLLSLVNNMAIKQNRAVAIFSSERSANKIIQRLIETETGVSLNKIRDGRLTDREKDHAQTMVNNISNADIHINDEQYLTIESIRKNSRLLSEEHNVDIIFVDYLQMLTASVHEPESRKKECRHIMQELRKLAGELNIPIVLLSQVNMNRTSARPSINDVSETVSEYSQNLLFLHRQNHWEFANGETPAGYTELLIARDSYCHKPGKVAIKFIESIDKFVNMETE